MAPILVHGDMWMNNIMWYKSDDGKSATDRLAAIVDWQVCATRKIFTNSSVHAMLMFVAIIWMNLSTTIWHV